MGGEGLLSEFPFGRICRMDGDMDSLYVFRGGRLVGWLVVEKLAEREIKDEREDASSPFARDRSFIFGRLC